MFSDAVYVPPEGQDPLASLCTEAEKALRAKVCQFHYPERLKGRACSHAIWKDIYREIDSMNEAILSAVTRKAGVYAILTADPEKDWQLQYLGQVKSSGSKMRMRSHLVWRNSETKSGKFTGSKFDEVQGALKLGQDIGLSFVEIKPASLRHYVEETLIGRFQPAWNLHGTTLLGQNSNRRCFGW